MSPLTLKVDSVQLSFDDRKILQDVYLSCTQGEVLGLLGRNGSGKSSLLKIIFGLIQPSYKYVSINDVYIKNGYEKNRIAYLSQQNYLPNGIRVSNLVKLLIDKDNWEEFASLNIYKDHSHKKTGELSGGELRQLEMLAILYSSADFILLDEPFTHVTPIQAEYFKTIIRSVSKRKGIIITDHQYYNVLDISDRVILLNDGCTKPIKHVDELVTYRYLSGIN